MRKRLKAKIMARTDMLMDSNCDAIERSILETKFVVHHRLPFGNSVA